MVVVAGLDERALASIRDRLHGLARRPRSPRSPRSAEPSEPIPRPTAIAARDRPVRLDVFLRGRRAGRLFFSAAELALPLADSVLARRRLTELLRHERILERDLSAVASWQCAAVLEQTPGGTPEVVSLCDSSMLPLGSIRDLLVARCKDRTVATIRVSAVLRPDWSESRPPAAGVQEPSRCLLYTSPSPRDVEESRMPSSA